MCQGWAGLLAVLLLAGCGDPLGHPLEISAPQSVTIPLSSVCWALGTTCDISMEIGTGWLGVQTRYVVVNPLVKPPILVVLTWHSQW